MVFANLQANEKDAFFSLLDEYFQSRPEIFAASSANSQDVSGVAASAVHRAMANNPEATAKIVSAGLRHAAGQTKPPGGTGGGAGAGGANASSENDVSSIAGRVAAASMAFSNRHHPSSSSSSSTSPPPVAEKPSSFSSVRQKFGEVDTSSPKNIFGSLRGSTAASKTNSPPPPQAPAPAFTARQNNNTNFGPPPTRHHPPPPPPPSRHQPEEEEEEEEEQQGEWANVLYDYDSGEAGDLVIKEGQQVLVTERTSDDWWTGELNGKKGLFPASYVEQL